MPILAHLPGRSGRPEPDARVVHEHVEAGNILSHLFRQPAHLGQRREVGHVGAGAVAKLIDELAHPLAVTAMGEHAPSGSGELLREIPAVS
jgi:hypothetical protein